jgi:uncharacterized protein YukE
VTATGIGILDSTTDCVQAISSGDWIEVGIDTSSVTLDVLSLVSNPAGALLSYGVGWLIEHVQALSEPLDWLAGRPEVISSQAEAWGGIAEAVREVRQDYARAVDTGLTGWHGTAAQAYHDRARDIDQLLNAASVAAEGIQVAITMSGMVVAAVRDQIREKIAELVGYLIFYAAELACSAGLAAPVIADQAMTLITRYAAEIAELVSKLLRTIKALMPLLRHLDEVLGTLRHGLARPLGPGSLR